MNHFFSSHCGHRMSVVRQSVLAATRPSFRLPSTISNPKQQGGISPIFTGLIGPPSELFKSFHFIKKTGCHANKSKHSKVLSKPGHIPKLFGINGHWNTFYQNCSNYFDRFVKYDHQVAWPVFPMSILGKRFYLKLQGLVREKTLLV